MPLIRQRRTRLSHDTMQPAARLPEQRTHSTPEGVSGEGKPSCTCGPHRSGENQSVRGGPSPLQETRTKHRRSTTNWKTSIDLTRIGMEQLHVRSHRSYPFWCSAIYRSWPIHCTESITRGVSAQKMLAFVTEHATVGTPVTRRPPYRPGRAVFPHPVPRLHSLPCRRCPFPGTL
jgi:hypothetical protein